MRITRQKIVGNFIADFYCAKAKLVIEVDGGQHYEDKAYQYDSEREIEMQKFGIKTARYTNNEIDRYFDAVCMDIDKHIKEEIEKRARGERI